MPNGKITLRRGDLIALGMALLIGLATGLSPNRALAQWEDPTDRPILINQLELKHGFVFVRRQVASSGILYVLNREVLAGRQNAQVVFDKQLNPRIFRFIQVLGDNRTVNAVGFMEGISGLISEARPKWVNFEAPLRQAVNEMMADFNRNPREITREVPMNDNAIATLRAQPVAGVAAIDIPIQRPSLKKPPVDQMLRLLNDASFLMIDPLGKKVDSYHAPNFRYVAIKEVEPEPEVDEFGEVIEPPPGSEPELLQVTVTGSWTISNQGDYCIEEAPIPKWVCYNLYLLDGNPVILEEQDGRLTSTARFHILREKGNIRNLPLLRVEDTLSAPRVRSVVNRRTERHRTQTEGQPYKIFFAGNGNYSGRTPSDETVLGRWAVLQDGRRCMRQVFPEEKDWACAFLRETDGGTFVQLTEDGEVIVEAVYELGNPENL